MQTNEDVTDVILDFYKWWLEKHVQFFHSSLKKKKKVLWHPLGA